MTPEKEQLLFEILCNLVERDCTVPYTDSSGKEFLMCKYCNHAIELLVEENAHGRGVHPSIELPHTSLHAATCIILKAQQASLQ
jgi:hypothetical protein